MVEEEHPSNDVVVEEVVVEEEHPSNDDVVEEVVVEEEHPSNDDVVEEVVVEEDQPSIDVVIEEEVVVEEDQPSNDDVVEEEPVVEEDQPSIDVVIEEEVVVEEDQPSNDVVVEEEVVVEEHVHHKDGDSKRSTVKIQCSYVFKRGKKSGVRCSRMVKHIDQKSDKVFCSNHKSFVKTRESNTNVQVVVTQPSSLNNDQKVRHPIHGLYTFSKPSEDLEFWAIRQQCTIHPVLQNRVYNPYHKILFIDAGGAIERVKKRCREKKQKFFEPGKQVICWNDSMVPYAMEIGGRVEYFIESERGFKYFMKKIKEMQYFDVENKEGEKWNYPQVPFIVTKMCEDLEYLENLGNRKSEEQWRHMNILNDITMKISNSRNPGSNLYGRFGALGYNDSYETLDKYNEQKQKRRSFKKNNSLYDDIVEPR